MIKQRILAFSCCVAIALSDFLVPAAAAKAEKGPHEDLPAYCARVGTDDTVRDYTPDLRDRTLRAYKTLQSGSGAQSTSQADPGELDVHLKADANYRCMNGRVMVCSVGANLPCVKINMARNIPEITKYCRENPGADDGHDLALAITGHDTGHSFQCRHGRAVVTGTTWALDKRGFAKKIWSVLPD
ncbi:hypothetical protein J8I29_17545 [Labrys sp. LIt4]|uniref:hypothetical protein n=1 Tax=Labrys sp. LIt4 TaxID=2821355 RepID=UPI001ADEC72C|nr:hypothetical protein [Labrys sp. LIt4]MBP0581135.1 hypothetical protein [Labrys sp. LIt4]